MSTDRPDEDERESPSDPDSPGPDKRRWLAVGVVAQVALLWAIAYGQSDGSLLLWGRDHTRRLLLGYEVPVSVFAAVPALLVLLLMPLFALAERSLTASLAAVKLLSGLACTAGAFGLMAGAAYFGGQPASPFWLLGCLGLLTLGELLVVPITQALVSQFPATYAQWHGYIAADKVVALRYP